MPSLALRRQVLPTAIAATLLTALLVLFPAHRAAAHDELVSSDPAADSTVETLPEEMTLTFSAALIASAGGTGVVVTDAAGNDVTAGAPEIDGAVLIQPLDPAAGTAGEYTVIWQVVSSDGHPTDGEFAFTVAEAASPATTEPTATGEPSPSASETAAPTPDATATPAPAATDSSPASAWIWALSIVGILAIVVAMVWFWLRGRRTASGAESDTPAEG
ncbi:copper resistance protein CopC [Microbacterium sp. M28]|uniref:copper resistance CopC family protein n=1 Tax=Microbacterium sp. M28 TaxID=2962064 RepID=UPI0021F3ED0E|nr:copper resistance CopC family protein [Microbacterium sp. M28]UYO95945.1 copper resistance protein CopC [Microbacterium sp. M28]